MLVAASFYPIEHFTSRVGGELVEVYNPVPAGAEPHDFELTPRSIERLQQARVFLYLGKGFQPAIDRALETIQSKEMLDRDVSAGITLSPAASDGERSQSTIDQHVWLDPALAQTMVGNIADALSQADQLNQDKYRANAEKLRMELAALDGEYASGLKDCKRKEIITSHAAFGYLARRYGIEQIAVSGLSPEAEPGPAQLQEVIRVARDRGAKYIFFETLADPSVARVIAEEVGAQTLVLNPIEGLTKEQVEAGEDYFSLMRHNLSNLKLALECP
jgi:zinc transport system substrate-binding protein